MFNNLDANSVSSYNVNTEKLREEIRRFSRDKRMVFQSNSPEETHLLGQLLGEDSKAGQVYTLTGDLGVGKTLFTQGFALGLGISEPVSSPTFTILQVYDTGRLPFYHFDVYRISDVDEMEEVGWEDYIYGDGVCMVEWAELVGEILPGSRFQVVIEKDPEKGFDYRRITLEQIDAAISPETIER